MFDLFNKSSSVRTLCNRLKPIIGDKADDIYRAYMAENVDGKKEIERYLELLSSKYLSSELQQTSLVPPDKSKSEGDYFLGTIQYGEKVFHDFYLQEKEMIQHVGIFGRSGAGKTNIGFSLLKELRKKSKPVLIFDWKRNYRDLLALPEFKDVEVYTLGRKVAPFRFNPLIPPPGTAPKTWLKKLIEVVAHAYCLGDGVLYMLQQAIDAVYEEAGYYTGEIKYHPTMRHVLDKVRNYSAKGREAGWLSSTLRALASLCFGEMDNLINQDQNSNLEHLLDNTVILELDALTQSDKVFVVQAIILWIHHKRMAEETREQFKHAIMIEEAHHILSNERRSLMGGQSVMEITFREIREFGEALIVLDQHPSMISLPAMGNTYTTICFNLKHKKDIGAMGQCMILDEAGKELLGKLEVGEAVMKLQGRVADPFLLAVPEFNINKGTITDDKISDLMEDKVFLAADYPVTETESIPTLVELFLIDIRDNPESGVAARYKRLSISVRQGQKIKYELLKAGLLTEEEIHNKTGRVIRLSLTQNGIDTLG
jgi:Helicase HerA, central domain